MIDFKKFVCVFILTLLSDTFCSDNIGLQNVSSRFYINKRISDSASNTLVLNRTLRSPQKISANDIKITRESWAEVEKDFEGTGTVLFTELFNDFPDYVQIFSRLKTKGEEDLFKSPKFRKHMTNALLPSISELLKNLDDEVALKDQLLLIGKNHRRRKLNRNQFENIKHVIVKTIGIKLGSAFTEEMKEAWLRVLSAGFEILYISLENDKY